MCCYGHVCITSGSGVLSTASLWGYHMYAKAKRRCGVCYGSIKNKKKTEASKTYHW